MKSILRSARSVRRLAIGSLLLPLALHRGRNETECELISVDVFETLVARRGEEHSAWVESTLHAAQMARAMALAVAPDPIAHRRKIESRLSIQRISSGRDPEFSNQMVLEILLREWGAGQHARDRAIELAAWELQLEIAHTAPLNAMITLVNQWAEAGRRVVAISDTRYSQSELATLLSHHGVTGLSAIYASADEGANKFSGELFNIVARREGVALRQMLHIGDSFVSDILSAAERSSAVRRISVKGNPGPLPLAPPLPTDCDDTAFKVGYQTFGPILVAFSRLLIHHARRDGIRRLAFVARDGELLMRITQTLIPEKDATCTGNSGISLQYLELSRRSLACASPDLQRMGTDADAVERIIKALRTIRGMGNSLLDSFRSYYNAPTDILMHHARRLRVEKGDEADVRRLLRDEEAATDLAQAFLPMRELVRRYLAQEDVLSESCALVDIGWHGSLHKILNSEAKGWNMSAPHAFYLGLWNEDSSIFPENATGLITDQRRGRSLSEGSAWHAAFLLEAVCRAGNGTVGGFIEGEDGRIQPIHIENGPARESEREHELTQSRIKNGALAYAKWYSRTYPVTVTDEKALRHGAQRRLVQLAFFPTEDELEMGHLLVHTEQTSDDAALRLIAKPKRSLKGWLAGIRSPWKGGYLRANGGAIVSGIFAAIEGAVSQLPPGTKPAIRRLIIRD